MSTTWTAVIEGLAFAEAPRFRDGALFVSDIFGGAVWRAGPTTEVVAEVPGRPSGTGWLPDGRLVVVSMRDRLVLVEGHGGLEVLADLSSLAAGDCNDMVVDGQGRAYVGNFGYDYAAGAPRQPADLIMVSPDGSACVVAEELWFPNGMAITPDGATLLVAESSANRVSAFSVAGDGSLSGRAVFATFGEGRPDGICLDAEGALWVASPATGELMRVLPGGEVTDRLDPPQGQAQACMLGGTDGRSLYVCSTPTHDFEEALRLRAGRVDVTRVEVAGAGWP